MSIEVNIEGKKLHYGISQLIENSETIGYLVENKNSNKNASIVLPSGKNLGDYCCKHCAIDAAWKKHHNIIDTKKQAKSGIPRNLLLMALIAAMTK